MISDIKQIIYSEEQLKEIACRIGNQINEDYKDKNPIFIGLLKGSVPFMSDLLKRITIPCTQDYLRVKSYLGASSTGIVNINGEKLSKSDLITPETIIDAKSNSFLYFFNQYVDGYGNRH